MVKRIIIGVLLGWLSQSTFGANHFVEDFDTLSCGYTDTSTVLQSGTWTVRQVYNEAAALSRGGVGHAARINDDTAGAHLTTPVLDTVGTVSFYFREYNSGGGTFKVQKSLDGGAFIDVASQTFSGTDYVFYSVNVNEAGDTVEIRILNDNNPGHLIIDDFTVTDYATTVTNPPVAHLPVLAVIGDQSVSERAPLDVDITATDSDGDAISLSADHLPPGSVLVDQGNGTARFVWASCGPVGVYTSAFYAVDSDGSDAEEVVFTVTESIHLTNDTITIMTANITSGNYQAYEAPGIRIFQALQPDIVGIQEFNYENDDLRLLVDNAFGPDYEYYVEPGSEQIPNGIISRYPILSSGEWEDTYVSNRDFAWAIIDIPGTQDLHVVSTHFLTSSATDRNNEAQLLMSYIQNNWATNDLIVLCGDFNTVNRSESALSTLSALFSDSHRPADQNGDMDTNGGRSSDYDYVLPNGPLNSLHTTTVVGGQSFSEGLVFDSRLWSPPPSPAYISDSGSDGMQHMAVLKTFSLSGSLAPPSTAVVYTVAGPHGALSPVDSSVPSGGSLTVTITPDDYYEVANVLIDGVSIGAPETYTFVNITNNFCITATFVEQYAVHEVPVLWLVSYGWTNDFDLAALSDTDQDGAPAWEEYIAGTVPTNDASSLTASGAYDMNEERLTLTWSSAEGRLYDIYILTNLLTDTWALYAQDLPATPPLNSYTGAVSQADCVHFRIRARK